MTGIIKIGKLNKNAAYYYIKDYDEHVGGKYIIIIVPLRDNNDKPFFYVKLQPDGRLELSGEAYIITDERLSRYIREAKENIGGMKPIYYWLDVNGEVTKKSYL